MEDIEEYKKKLLKQVKNEIGQSYTIWVGVIFFSLMIGCLIYVLLCYLLPISLATVYITNFRPVPAILLVLMGFSFSCLSLLSKNSRVIKKAFKKKIVEKIKNYPQELTRAGEKFKQAEKELSNVKNEFSLLQIILKEL